MAIGSLKSRLRAKFSRHSSTTSTNSWETSHGNSREQSLISLKSNTATNQNPSSIHDNIPRSERAAEESRLAATELELQSNDRRDIQTTLNSFELKIAQEHDSSPTSDTFQTSNTNVKPIEELDENKAEQVAHGDLDNQEPVPIPGSVLETNTATVDSELAVAPTNIVRRQSILPTQQTRLIQTLLDTQIPPPSRASNLDYFSSNDPATISPNMVSRKIWVKRPNASATLVSINEEDLVDDVRDMILKKYSNSLGRTFDAPDVTLRICPREQRQERTLGPEEPMSRTLDAYFPGGQTVEEALIIDVPLRRTPKPSPRGGPPVAYYHDELRPGEAGSDYFPPMPVPAMPSPHLPTSVPVSTIAGPPTSSHHPNSSSHSMSVLTTGHVPNLPSPGGSRRHYSRPRVTRTHTTSPSVSNSHIQTPMPLNNGTLIHPRAGRSRTHSSASEKSIAPPAPPPLPTPPAADVSTIQRTSTPPPRVSSPRVVTRAKKIKKSSDHPSLPAGLLNGAVPPINVLIVEDNIINLKLLEAFMKRLKVRWQTAMNGKEAVTKWRAGGFHLVLMDIQLPVMNGLEATREIRRLEKLNSIGVFSSSASSSAPEQADEPEGDDKLPSSVLFKSPVIIVALTASSLQSDRHEALAAGCNDFLTKPVNFVWLERKVMEWGCMQALIDFDGWRKWKDFSQMNEESEKKSTGLKAKKKNRMSLGSSTNGTAVVTSIKEEADMKH